MSDEHDSSSDKSPDLKARLKQITQPLIDSLDSKIRDQVDHRVDERVDEKVEQSLSARLDRTGHRGPRSRDQGIEEGRYDLGPDPISARRSRSRRIANRTVSTHNTITATTKIEKTAMNTTPR